MDNSCCSELVFGFLPAGVLQSVNEVGNWKTRSSAIEQVQHGLASLGPAQTQVLLQQLPEFVGFVLQLLADHNFKVVIAGLSVLGNAASSLGHALQQHMGEVSPVLLNKLLDHRAPVSAAAVKAAASIMQHSHRSNPAAFVNRLLQLHKQHEAASGQDTSGLLELLILAMLRGPMNSLDLPASASLLLKSMQRSISTSITGNKQHALAMEAFALATDNLGAQLPNLLKQAGGTDLQVTLVLTQVQQLQRPSLAADGSIQHNIAAQTAIAAADASVAGGSSFRIGAGLYDRGNNSSSSSINSESSISMGLGSLKFSSVGGSNSKGGAEEVASTSSAEDSLSSAWGGEQQHQQMLPPGSLGALAAHARLISNASSSIAAAAAAGYSNGGNSSSGGSRPSSGINAGRGAQGSTGQEGRYSNKLQLSLSSSSLGLEQPYSAGRSPLGSPRAQAGAGSVGGSHAHSHLQPSGPSGDWASSQEAPGPPHWHNDANQANSSNPAFSSSSNSTVQQQQVQTQLSKLQLYDSSRYTANRQDSQLQQDAAATTTTTTVSRVQQQQQAGRSSSEWTSSQPATGSPAALLNVPTQNLRYQQSAGSSNTGAVAGRRSTADQQSRGPTLESAPQLTGAEAAAGNSNTSWLAAAGPGWAPTDAASIDAASGAYSPGRAETLSPSRGERLAFLKRRQVEKRAVSATGSTRGSTPFDSQDGVLAAAAAATAPMGSGSMDSLGPRAVTAGPAGTGNNTGWRLSNSTESASGAGFAQTGYGLSSSPAPGEEGSTGSSSGRGGQGALLQWHIPTGPGGRFLPPGSTSAAQQQQQRQYSSSPEPSSLSQRSQGPYSPSTSWDNSNGLAAGRAFQSSTGRAPVTGSPHTGQLLQNVNRTVSAAAVLVNAGSDGGGSPSSSGMAESSGPSGTGGIAYRSSRFLQVRSQSSSPAPPDVSSHGSCLPLGSIRQVHGAGTNSTTGFGRHQQQSQPSQGPLQGNLANRAQTAAPALSAGGLGAGDWGTGTSSSPASRLVSACGPNGSGCFGGSAGAAGPGPGSMAGTGSPTRSPGGMSGRVSNGFKGVTGGDRPQSSGIAEVDLAGADLAPLHDPEASLRQAVAKLQQANTATRKEIDWQGQLDSLVDARKLIAHHPEVLRHSARELVLAALPAVDELRSTTSRMALLFFQELPGSGLSIERELDEVVPVLLKKAGDLSTAGRDNFLAQEAAKALSLICGAVSESKALSALIAAGASHKSPHVRSRTAAHLDEVAAGGAGLEALLRSGNWAVLDKLFKTAAGFLQEGSLDTRTYGKRLLWAVKAVLRGNRPDMDRLMSGITPEGTQRRVVEVLEGLSAPPPPPTNRLGSSAGPRVVSRNGQQSSAPSTPTSGIQAMAPFSAPPAAMLTAAGTAAAAAGVGQDGAHSVPGRAGYGGVGSTSSSAARRALFNSSSGNASNGLQVQGAAAATAESPGSPGSPTLSGSSSGRRRSTVSALAGNSRTAGSPAASGSASPAGGSHAGACGGMGSVSGSDRRMSGGCPAGPPGPMSPELQEAVDQVGLQLGSKDWRNRMDALRALSALGPALPEVPNAALDGLLQALVGRLSDGNAKVNQKALEVLCEVVYTINLRTLLIMPSLMPALTANLGSTNDKLRSCASSALDVVASTVVPQPQLLIQGLAQAVSNGSVRTKVAVTEKLGVLLPALHQAQPQLTRLLLPAAFSLALEARGEAKAAAAQLLALLTALLGSSAVLSAAAVVSSATEQRVREFVFGGAARS